MISKINFEFKVRKKKGALAGEVISEEVPEFDWESFKKAPNAEEFVKRAYYSVIKQLIREAKEAQYNTTSNDLATYETVIAKSLSFKKHEIKEWLNSRNWENVSNINKETIEKIKERLPELASSDGVYLFKKEQRAEIAYKVIIEIADTIDPIAEYIVSELTKDEAPEIKLDLDF